MELQRQIIVASILALSLSMMTDLPDSIGPCHYHGQHRLYVKRRAVWGNVNFLQKLLLMPRLALDWKNTRCTTTTSFLYLHLKNRGYTSMYCRLTDAIQCIFICLNVPSVFLNSHREIQKPGLICATTYFVLG